MDSGLIYSPRGVVELNLYLTWYPNLSVHWLVGPFVGCLVSTVMHYSLSSFCVAAPVHLSILFLLAFNKVSRMRWTRELWINSVLTIISKKKKYAEKKERGMEHKGKAKGKYCPSLFIPELRQRFWEGITDLRTDGRTDGRTGRRTDGRMDGRTDRRTDRWTDRPSYRDA